MGTKKTNGRFITDKVTAPPISVDCSDWVDTTEGWTFGKFITAKETREAVVVDCTDWDAEPTEPQLAVNVQFEDGALSDTFVQAIRQTAATRLADNTVVVALRDPSAVAALYEAFQGLQSAGCVIGTEPGGFRVRRKAS